MNDYEVVLNDDSVEISCDETRIRLYRFPYNEVRNGHYDFDIENNFIVYVLYGHNNKGSDLVYIGESKNGLVNRPKSHEDKCSFWSDCYVLTEEVSDKSIFDDAVIHYLEDKLTELFRKTNRFLVRTERTMNNTINRNQTKKCERYLKDAERMFFVLGLNLQAGQTEETKGKKSISKGRGPKQSANSVFPTITEKDCQEMKVGALVYTSMQRLSACGFYLPEELLQQMQDSEWGVKMKITGNHLPFIKPCITGLEEEQIIRGYRRYRRKPVELNGKQFYITKELFAKNEQPFIEWYNGLKSQVTMNKQ